MSVAIIDYGSGNLHSARKAFERAAREAGASREIKVTARPEDVLAADHVVLPGVGAFADCRRGLDGVAGMVEAMEEAARKRGRPFLGICVGAQLLGDARPRARSRRRPRLDCRRRRADQAARSGLEDSAHGVEHPRRCSASHPLLDGVRTGPSGLHAYFVHSYQLYPDDAGDVVATADYGGRVTAVVARDNIAGTQFHPEKSQTLGLALIANFLKWRP